jgi:class 3 adenylate cyclase/tetratricopeptide (TPR) repeat protein
MDQPTIDQLLDRAIQAINRGDRATASMLAGKVLAVDRANPEAEDLLAAPVNSGEIRRLTIMFADLVDSTALSTRVEAEIYRTVVGRYKELVRQVVDRYEGHIGSTKGDGLLAVFGHPRAHENDVHRAVQAGLDVTRQVARLSEQVQRRFGFAIDVRVGIHRGLVYLDIVQDDVYGLAANLAARVSGLAPPSTVVVSDAIEPLVRRDFELEVRPAQHVKGIEGPVAHHRVVAEKTHATHSPRGPLIGRHRELSFVRARWDDARAGALTEPGMGFFGEPGIGKSRLATAAADLVEDSGGIVLALQGSPFHTDSGLHPARMLLERRCHIGRTTPQHERLQLLEAEVRARSLDPATTVPLLAPVLGVPADTGYEPVSADGHTLYERIRAALCDYLLACLDDGPGLVLVEDLQWFDTSTLDVVRSLLGTKTGRLLVIITGREGALPADLVNVSVFELVPLTDVESDELAITLEPTLSADQRAEVRRRCDGVPLYIEEVVAKLDQQPTDASQWVRVPDALYEPLFARLRASKNAVPVVEAAATIGRQVDRGLLNSVVTLSEDEVDAVIDQLVAARVLVRSGIDSWRFRHELLREVAAELPPPSQRRLLHGRVADALVDAGAGQPDWSLVAFHCQQAERFDEAAKACQRAASEARRRGALGEARKFLTHAISNIEKLPPNPTRDQLEIPIRLRRGFLTSATAGPTSPEAAADFERCLQLSGNYLTDEVLSTLAALFGYYMNRGDLRRAVRLLESGRVAVAGGPAWLRVANEVGFATTAWYSGDFHTARRELEKLAAARSDVDTGAIEAAWFMPHEPVASIYTVLSLARFVQGDLDGAEAAMTEARVRCEDLGFPHGPFSLAYAQSLETWIRGEAGQLDAAGESVEVLHRIAGRYGFDAWRLIGAAESALVDGLTALTAKIVMPAGVKPHIAAVSGVVQAMTALEVKPFLSVYDALLARLWMAAGKPDRARDRLDSALKRAEDTGIHFYDAELLRLHAHTRDSSIRHSGLRAAIDVADRQGAVIFQLRAAADDFELRTDSAARRALRDAVDRFPDGSSWPQLAWARALLA